MIELEHGSHLQHVTLDANDRVLFLGFTARVDAYRVAHLEALGVRHSEELSAAALRLRAALRDRAFLCQGSAPAHRSAHLFAAGGSAVAVLQRAAAQCAERVVGAGFLVAVHIGHCHAEPGRAQPADNPQQDQRVQLVDDAVTVHVSRIDSDDDLAGCVGQRHAVRRT